jgi:hypothetical protein
MKRTGPSPGRNWPAELEIFSDTWSLPSFTHALVFSTKTADSAPSGKGQSSTFFTREFKKGLTSTSDTFIKLPGQSGSHFDWFLSPERIGFSRRHFPETGDDKRGLPDVGQTSPGAGRPCDTRPRYRFPRFTTGWPVNTGKSEA